MTLHEAGHHVTYQSMHQKQQPQDVTPQQQPAVNGKDLKNASFHSTASSSHHPDDHHAAPSSPVNVNIHSSVGSHTSIGSAADLSDANNAQQQSSGGGGGHSAGQVYLQRLHDIQRKYGIKNKTGAASDAPPTSVEKENGSAAPTSREEAARKASTLRERMARIRELQSNSKDQQQ